LLKALLPSIAVAAILLSPPSHAGQWVTYEDKDGPGKGKQIVLLAGDEEYRSEEGLPQLGKILSQRHGFKCTVLFSQDPKDGTLDPNNQTNIPGMQLIDSADLVIMQFRFRELPDPDMKHLVDFLQSGKPIIALRTSTHAFNYTRNKQSPYAKYSFDGREWRGGFGQEVLGDTWISHHGNHKVESTRGLVDGLNEKHPVLRGVQDVWGPTDVYGIIHLKPGDKILLYGLTLQGMKPSDLPNYNKSIMPIAWTRDYAWENGKTTRSLTTTMGAATDLECADLRRLLVNACYWLTGIEVPNRADVELVGEYKPSAFGFNGFKKGVKPAEHELPN
jgi:type 1 glutamine amidotransferase